MFQFTSRIFIFIVVLTACCTPSSEQSMPQAMIQTVERLNKIFNNSPETRLLVPDSLALDTVIDWLSKHPKHLSLDAIRAYQMRGAGLLTIGNIFESEPYFETALSMGYKLQVNDTDSLKLIRGNIASFLYYSCWQEADFEGALSYLDVCFKEYGAIKDSALQVDKNYYIMQSYSNQAGIFNSIIQPQLAKNALSKGYAYLPNLPPDAAQFIGLNYLNFEALGDIKMVDSLNTRLSIVVSDSFINAAIQKWEKLLKNPLPDEPKFIMSGHLANAYLMLNKPTSEAQIINLLNKMDKMIHSNFRWDMLLTTIKSSYYSKFGKWQEAEKELNEGLNKLKNNKSSKNALYTSVEYPTQYMNLLSTKINLYKNAPVKRNKTDSLILMGLYDEFIYFFDKIREQTQNASLFKNWTDRYFFYFQEGTELCPVLFKRTQDEKYLQKMLEYSERGKFFILCRNILQKREGDEEIRRVRQRYKHFKMRLTEIPSDKNAKDSLKYYTFKNDSLTKLYPNIDSLKSPKITDIRQNLMTNEDVAFIEFTAVSQKRLVGVVITQKKAFSFQSDSLAVILTLAEQFESQAWKEGEYKDNEFGDFHKAQYRIYQYLLAAILKQLPPTITRLVIVPDSKLAVVPFASLLTEPITGAFIPSRDKAYYLIKKYALTIMPSFNVYAVLPTSTLTKNAKSVGLSACFDKMNALNRPLLFLDSFAKQQAGEKKYYQVCEKTSILTVLSKIKQDEIPIIVAHGDISAKDFNDYGFRLSNTEMLNSSDIMREKFNFPFAILAASCNTAAGVEERGEGIATLARSCMQAGVSSLLATTIDIKEKETAQVLTSFFTYFKPNNADKHSYYPKDIALQKAQLDMIEDNRHPIDWAHVVLIGDFSPLR